MKKAFLSAREFSRLMRIHLMTLQRLMREGKVPGAFQLSGKRNGKWRIPADVTDRMIEHYKTDAEVQEWMDAPMGRGNDYEADREAEG